MTSRYFVLWSFLFCLFAHISLSAQQPIATPPRKTKKHPRPIIEWRQEGNAYVFKVKAEPKLTPDAQADPYFDYHWEFGDGQFARKNREVRHVYARTGKFTVRVWMTPCGSIDFIENPAEAEAQVIATGTSSPATLKKAIEFSTNHHPRVAEDMVATISYRHPLASWTDGRIYLFFNEKKTSKKAKILSLKEGSIRAYNGERLTTETPDLGQFDALRQADAAYLDKLVFDVKRMTPSVQNLFFTFKEVPENVNLHKGTKVRLRAAIVAGGKIDWEDIELELKQSHDPNDIRVNPSYLSFKFVENRAFIYTVRFQNTGEATEPSVFIKINRPPMTDTTRFDLLDYAPKCPICPTDVDIAYRDTFLCLRPIYHRDSIEFRFYGINLNGTKQAGVKDRATTEGYVRYRVYPISSGMKKVTMSSRAHIDFGGKVKKTDAADVEFSPGLMFGPKAGLNFDPRTGQTSYFVGLTLSPYKPSGMYLQFEILGDLTSLSQNRNYISDSTRTKMDNQICQDCYRDTLGLVTENIRQSAFNFVPLQVRWDLSKVLSVGFGASMDMYIRRIETTQTVVTRTVQENCTLKYIESPPTVGSRKVTTFKLAPFIDVGVGIQDFKIGGRYIIPIGDARSDYYQFYATYKF